MAIREGKWRCTYCSVVNRGSAMACLGCGAVREQDVQFFLEEDAAEVAEEALLARAAVGADWLCAFCGTSNANDLKHCRQCGAERGTSPSRAVVDIPAAAPVAATGSVGKSGGSGCLKWVVVLLLLATAFCGVLGYLSLRKTEEKVTVLGREWQRSIQVEELRTVREEAWQDQVPSEARVVSRKREVRRTEKVQDGTERVKVGTRDKGNGFFEDVYEDQPRYKEEEVYDTKVSYEIKRWVKARAPSVSGRQPDPTWPEAQLGANEREGSRTETYVVLLQGRDTTYRMEMPQEQWMRVEEGKSFDATIQGGSTVLELK